MSKKISISNFIKMSPDIPGYSDKNQHYLLSGVEPTYYLGETGAQEQQVAPLVASNQWSSPSGFGSPTQKTDLCESTEGTYSAYAIDIQSFVYGIDIPTGTVQTNITSFNGNIHNSYFHKIKCFNGNLVVVRADSNNIYINPLPATHNGYIDLGVLLASGSEHFMENFLQYCMISDGSLVYPFGASNTLGNPLTLGAGWTVLGLDNYNDKYLAIAGSIGNFTQNYLFMWDGISAKYNYSVKIPGKFLGMKTIQGTLYIAVQNTSGSGAYYQTSIYYLKGTQLVYMFTPQVSNINGRSTSVTRQSVFNFNEKLGIVLTSGELMVHGSSTRGIEQYIISSGIIPDKLTRTYDGYTLFTSVGSGTYGYYNAGVSTVHNNISYKSQWIPVKNLQGLDVWYNSPPSTTGEKISITIYGRGENIISGSQTIALPDITSTNFLNNKRTRLDVAGFSGDEVQITLTTTNTGSWRPIIRKIDLITK